MDTGLNESSTVKTRIGHPCICRHNYKSSQTGSIPNMESVDVPDCHDYPAINTQFATMDQFKQFKKFFCHMRNRNFQPYNNSTSAIYLCPNYKKCHGLLHGCRNKKPILDEDGNVQYDRNGYPKYRNLPHLTIGPLTNPCSCMPDRYTSIKGASKVFERMLHTTNVSRTEFTHLANSYFAIAGKDNFAFKSNGYNLAWSCQLCDAGCLQLTMNRNTAKGPSRYQTYGRISKASPCSPDCPSRTCSFAKKTIWLPKSHMEEEMAITPEQIEHKKEQHNIWVTEARVIAQGLLTQQEIKKKSWKLSYMTEQELRKQIKVRNTKISESNKNRATSAKLQVSNTKQPTAHRPPSSSMSQTDKLDKPDKPKGKHTQIQPARRSSRIQGR